MGPLGIQANEEFLSGPPFGGRTLPRLLLGRQPFTTPGDTNGKTNSFVRDRKTGTTTLVSMSSSGVRGNDDSIYPTVSTDGRFVAFFSFATNLVAGDTNGQTDAFVRDRKLGTTTRASVGQFGLQGNEDTFVPEISADGRFVAFSPMLNLVISGGTGIFVRTLAP